MSKYDFGEGPKDYYKRDPIETAKVLWVSKLDIPDELKKWENVTIWTEVQECLQNGDAYTQTVWRTLERIIYRFNYLVIDETVPASIGYEIGKIMSYDTTEFKLRFYKRFEDGTGRLSSAVSEYNEVL